MIAKRKQSKAQRLASQRNIKKAQAARRKQGPTLGTDYPRRQAAPRLGDFPGLVGVRIPKGGLLDPSLRRDIGNVPGLAPAK